MGQLGFSDKQIDQLFQEQRIVLVDDGNARSASIKGIEVIVADPQGAFLQQLRTDYVTRTRGLKQEDKREFPFPSVTSPSGAGAASFSFASSTSVVPGVAPSSAHNPAASSNWRAGFDFGQGYVSAAEAPSNPAQPFLDVEEGAVPSSAQPVSEQNEGGIANKQG